MRALVRSISQSWSSAPRVLVALLGLAIVLLGCDLVGPLSALYRLAAVRGLGLSLALAAIFLSAGARDGIDTALRRLALLALASALLAVERTWIAAIVVVAMSVLAEPLFAARAAWPRGLSRALTCALVFALLPQLDPSRWHSLENAFSSFAQRMGLAPATPTSMPGIIASGLFATALGVVFALALVPRRRVAVLALLALAGSGLWMASEFAGTSVNRTFQEAIVAHWRWSLAVPVVLVALVVAWRRDSDVASASDSPAFVGWRTAVLGAIAAVSAFAVFSPERVAIAKGTRVAILESGGAEFDVPEYGRFGAFSQGMFGLLASTLERSGLTARRVAATADLIAEIDESEVLIVINSDRVWSDAELAATERFVRNGGRLIVMGDHTDVFGLLEPTNRLLAPFGIAFRFDSAYPLEGQGFRKAQRTAFARIHWSYRGNYAPTTGIGGSLVIAPPAYPLVWSDAAFSDLGVRGNIQGSFLGNYSLDSGEEVGSQVLVAGRDVGRGRVLVFGDTTLFQNGGLDYTFEHEVEPIFEWLLAESTGGTTKPWLGIGCLGLLLIFLLTRSSAESGFVALVTALVACFASDEFRNEAYPHPARHGDIVVAHEFAQRFGDYDTEGSFIGPLIASARRSGLAVKYLADLDDPERFRDASALVLVAPRVPIDRATIHEITEFAKDGGTLFLVAGGRDASGFQDLFDAIGVRVQSRLLAERAELGDLDFVEPYPLDLPQEARMLAEIDGQPVIGFVPLGAGGAVVVGDTRFFSTRNMEGTYSFDANVIAFTQQLFEKFVARRVAQSSSETENEVKHAAGN